MQRPRVYLHVAGLHYYREIVAEIAGTINGSGLYGEAASLKAVCVAQADLTYLLGEKWDVIRTGLDADAFEFPTLQLLHADSFSMPDDTPILYVHTKGASVVDMRGRRHKGEWRRYMLHWIVGHWRQCVELLQDNQVAGTNWYPSPWMPWHHFGGNFWWGRADYIRSLVVPMATLPWNYRRSPRYIAEMWIGSGRPSQVVSLNEMGMGCTHRATSISERATRDDWRERNDRGLWE